MDKDVKIQELKDKIKKFCEDRDWDQFHGAKELAIGIVTEASEILDYFRFKSNKEVEEIFKNSEKKEHISEELADILYNVLRIAQKYQIDISSEFNKKMAKNEKRYPINKSKGLNKRYDSKLNL